VRGFPAAYQVVVRCTFSNMLLLPYEHIEHRILPKQRRQGMSTANQLMKRHLEDCQEKRLTISARLANLIPASQQGKLLDDDDTV